MRRNKTQAFTKVYTIVTEVVYTVVVFFVLFTYTSCILKVDFRSKKYIFICTS